MATGQLQVSMMETWCVLLPGGFTGESLSGIFKRANTFLSDIGVVMGC